MNIVCIEIIRANGSTTRNIDIFYVVYLASSSFYFELDNSPAISIILIGFSYILNVCL